MRTLSASAAAALLPNMPRLSMRMVDTPFAASASASRRYIPAVTPCGLLPSRSVGPEPGMMIATGAFGPPSGAASVPWRAPDGPSMLRRVSAADALVAAARMTASVAAASFMTLCPTSRCVYQGNTTPGRSVTTTRRIRFRPLPRQRESAVPCRKSECALLRCSSTGGLRMLVRALIVTATAVAAISFTSTATSIAQAQVVDFSKYPDFSGQWKRPDGVGIQWDQTKPFGPRQQPPLTPEYQARYEASLKDQAAG